MPELFDNGPAGQAAGYSRKYAEISDCGRFRWLLGREWAPGPIMLFVMLNPSTANSDFDDPTIRRCRGYARREGAGSLEVVNLVPWRATNPRDLLGTWHSWQKPAIEAENLRWIRQAAVRADTVICAWGAFVATLDAKCGARPAPDVLQAIADAGRQPLCLGLTGAGHPKHPLYVDGDAPLQPLLRGGA